MCSSFSKLTFNFQKNLPTFVSLKCISIKPALRSLSTRNDCILSQCVAHAYGREFDDPRTGGFKKDLPWLNYCRVWHPWGQDGWYIADSCLVCFFLCVFKNLSVSTATYLCISGGGFTFVRPRFLTPYICNTSFWLFHSRQPELPLHSVQSVNDSVTKEMFHVLSFVWGCSCCHLQPPHSCCRLQPPHFCYSTPGRHWHHRDSCGI